MSKDGPRAEPCRRQRRGSIQRVAKRLAARAFRDPPVQILMQFQVHKPVRFGLHRKHIHPRRQLDQLGALRDGVATSANSASRIAPPTLRQRTIYWPRTSSSVGRRTRVPARGPALLKALRFQDAGALPRQAGNSSPTPPPVSGARWPVRSRVRRAESAPVRSRKLRRPIRLFRDCASSLYNITFLEEIRPGNLREM